jgi:penicillin-binding protein 2
VGAIKLTDWAKSFGLGKETGIDLPGEVTGFVPDPAKTDWYLGNTYHLSIGQGSLLTTPLQINMMTGVIADDGRLCRP